MSSKMCLRLLNIPKLSFGPNPMNGKQGCIYNYLHSQVYVKFLSYETFLPVFTKKFYKHLTQVKSFLTSGKSRKLYSQVRFSLKSRDDFSGIFG